ncbi:MAG: CRTAC1 family protein, partial [Pirellulaceae bacterium]|nr:CRTAC1 family protein [Pirellulaceae bacterium]
MQSKIITRLCLVATIGLSLFYGEQTGAQDPIFENVTEAAGLAGGEFVAWADYNNDGHVDLSTSGKLFRNGGNGKFTPVESFASSHGAWADFDNDGKLDFYGAGGEGGLLRNLGDDRFETVPIPANAHKMSRAAAWGDANNDGAVDLLVTNYEVWNVRGFPDLLYMNQGDGTFALPVTSGILMRNRGNDNAWLKVKAIGDGKSNDAAIGARITVNAGDKSYVREVQAGNSGNQNPFVAHFGLGQHTDPVDVTVRFPSGKIVK